VLVIDDSITILKVVGTILERHGYQVLVARDGREALEALRAVGSVDAILLDFVMPRMNGYQFCRELRADPQLKQLPVVLMSARTNVIGDRFVEQTGAVDALSKPFDARALVAVVGAVLAKRADHSDQRVMPAPEAMLDEEELSMPLAPPPERRSGGVSVYAATLAEVLGPHFALLRVDELRQPKLLEDAILRALEGEVLGRLSAAMDDVGQGTSNEIMRGEIGKMPLAELLQLFQLRRQTGVLEVRHGSRGMTLAIREGMLEMAQSVGTDDEFRLGRYFVEKRLIKREEIDEIVRQQPQGKLLGQLLLEAGRIDEHQLFMALAKQSAELVYEVLRWQEGRFVLREEAFSPEAESAQLGLGLSELVLEGFRRVDEWRLMADTIDFDAVLLVDHVALGTVDESKIGKTERPVLEAINGERTVRQVMEAVDDLASFDAIKAIYRFIQSRIVREVKLGATGRGPAQGEGSWTGSERRHRSSRPSAPSEITDAMPELRPSGAPPLAHEETAPDDSAQDALR
jgi:CheY-like chemotaxis protein